MGGVKDVCNSTKSNPFGICVIYSHIKRARLQLPGYRHNFLDDSNLRTIEPSLTSAENLWFSSTLSQETCENYNIGLKISLRQTLESSNYSLNLWKIKIKNLLSYPSA